MKRKPASDPDAERLIRKLGSKRAAIAAIKQAEAKGRGGRRDGTQKYLNADLEILFQSDLLQAEHRLQNLRRERAGRSAMKEPKRRERIAAYVPEKAEQAGLGKTRNAAIARVARRGSLGRILIDMIRQHRPDLMRSWPADVDVRLRSIEDNPDKVNFGTILFLFIALAGALRKYPRLREKIAALSNPAARNDVET